MRTPTVCKEYLDNLLEYLEGQGLSSRQLQSVLRLNPLSHISEQGRVPLRLFEMTLDAGANLLGDPCLGAKAGTHCSRTPWGMVNYLGMSASNTREAVDAMQRFSRLLIDHGDMVLSEVNSSTACLSWQQPPRQQASVHVVEFFFANWYRVNKPMLDRGATRREVHFAHAAQGREVEMEALFEAPVSFGKKLNAVHFGRELLDQPTLYPHPGIHKSLEQAALIELSNLQFEDRLIKDVRDCIVSQLADGVPRLEDISAQLGIAPRTLQRRLNNTETSYKSLVDDARKERSLGLISRRELGLLEISAELGFSDQSAFQKAFKRWYGQAPGRYRMMLQSA
ncbi:AraC family transcriptional regulator [uncultured Spongiibacter sp.]|uniref:AraC family transcriptional regulator n=1 Tax=uncultured Spongiibacter sp. TaxID=870896 RepID=UPI00258E43A1|nr:AraC family transcriptional regulator [uncultured Spongiibacter sp.]